MNSSNFDTLKIIDPGPEIIDYYGPAIYIDTMEYIIIITIFVLLLVWFNKTNLKEKLLKKLIFNICFIITFIVSLVMMQYEYGYQGYLRTLYGLIIYSVLVVVMVLVSIIKLIKTKKLNKTSKGEK